MLRLSTCVACWLRVAGVRNTCLFPRSCWVETDVLAVAKVAVLKAKVFHSRGIVFVKVGVAITLILTTFIFFFIFFVIKTLRPTLDTTSATITKPALVTTSGH